MGEACTQCGAGVNKCTDVDELDGAGWPAETLGFSIAGGFQNGGCQTESGGLGKGACAARACACEAQFIEEALVLLDANNVGADYAKFSHDSGFHPKYQCPLY